MLQCYCNYSSTARHWTESFPGHARRIQFEPPLRLRTPQIKTHLPQRPRLAQRCVSVGAAPSGSPSCSSSARPSRCSCCRTARRRDSACFASPRASGATCAVTSVYCTQKKAVRLRRTISLAVSAGRCRRLIHHCSVRNFFISSTNALYVRLYRDHDLNIIDQGKYKHCLCCAIDLLKISQNSIH